MQGKKQQEFGRPQGLLMTDDTGTDARCSGYAVVACDEASSEIHRTLRHGRPDNHCHKVGTPSPMGEANEGNWGVGSAHITLRAGEPSAWGRG